MIKKVLLALVISVVAAVIVYAPAAQSKIKLADIKTVSHSQSAIPVNPNCAWFVELVD